MAEASEQLLGMRLTGRSRGALFLRELEAARPQGVEPQSSIVVEGMAGIGAKAPSNLSPKDGRLSASRRPYAPGIKC